MGSVCYEVRYVVSLRKAYYRIKNPVFICAAGMFRIPVIHLPDSFAVISVDYPAVIEHLATPAFADGIHVQFHILF